MGTGYHGKGLGAIASFPYHNDPRSALDEHAQTRTHHCVVIDNDDAYGLGERRGHTTPPLRHYMDCRSMVASRTAARNTWRRTVG